MELRSCSDLHFIEAIKGGLVTKAPNVSCGIPTLRFRKLTNIYEDFMFDNDNVKTKRSCIGVMEERVVKIEPDVFISDINDDNGIGVMEERVVKIEPNVFVSDTNDNNDQRIINLDDDGFDNFTLKQIKERCKTRKRKHSQGLDSSATKTGNEDLSSMEYSREKQQLEDDSDLMETLSNLRTKLSNNSKAKKKKCVKARISTQESVPVVEAEEILIVQDSSTTCGDSAALDEVKLEVPEDDCLDCWSVIEGKEDCSLIEDTEITHERNLEIELHSQWEEYIYHIPLQMVSPPCMDIVIMNSELSNNQSTNFPALEFEDRSSSIHYNQLDDDIDAPVSPPNVDIIHKGLDCTGVESGDDGTLLNDCSIDEITADVKSGDDGTLLNDLSKDEITVDAEVQAKPCSSVEHGIDPDAFLDFASDVSPEYEEKQSFASVYDDVKRCVNETTDKLTSLDEHKGSPKLHAPERLLSTRKAISPTSQEQLCKAMESVDLDHKSNLKWRGKLNFTEQADKNGDAEGLNDIMGTGITNNPQKISVCRKTSKRGSNSKVISKNPHSSRPATRLGCSTLQSCSKSAIAFSKQQMHDIELVALRLTKELKSMKEIMDNMLRSEFCLNTPLRNKVNEARMAVKNATKAEEGAKRCLSFMSRDCNRFCKIMQLADDGSPSPSRAQDVVRKEKRIAFADEAGGNLCQVRVYEDDEVHLPEGMLL